MPMMLAPLLEIVIPGPADREIEPELVEVPAPTPFTKFAGALIETLNAPAAVDADKLILLPANMSNDTAVPDTVEVPAANV